jgi:hypothetical protein
VLKAYKAAVAAGVSPAEFWGMTPYLTGQAVIAMNDETTTRIWTLAAMTRAKKLPKLDKLLSKTKPEKKDMGGLKMALAGIIPKKRTENG